MIRGIGTDVVSVGRINRLVEARGEAFLGKWFTAAEIAYCQAKAHPVRHFAARFAAKEAVFKALAPDWSGAVPWSCIEVVADSSGAPRVVLSGPIARVAEAAGVEIVHVSLSHCDEYATATAVVEGPG